MARDKAGEVTIILLVVKGNLSLFDDETMHYIEAVADGVNSVKIVLSGKKKTDEFIGHRIDQILLQM